MVRCMDSGEVGRRGYLRSVGGSLAFGGLTVGNSAATSLSEVTVTGRVESFNGEPVANRKLKFTKSTDGSYTETDANGRFETTVAADSSNKVALYKSGSGQLHAPERNGVPHIYVLDKFYARSSDEDIGTLAAPQAYRVDVRALKEDGSPATNAEFDFRAYFEEQSWFGASRHWLSANQEGYLVIWNADFTGVELSGHSAVTVEIPLESGGTQKFTQELDVDQPMTVTAQTREGISVEPHGSSNSTDENTTTTTTEKTQTATTTKAETTETTTESTDQPNSTATTTEQATTVNTNNPSETAASRPKRGFFSNENPETEYEFLSDPFFLTFGGFALSILGVLHNMVK